MPLDALHMDEDGNFPNLPRREDGSLDTTSMPTGTRRGRTPDGRVILIDVEPTLPDGRRPSEVPPLPAT